jgi:plasmid stability protein
MAQVIIRKLDDNVVARLKQRARAKGLRLEQELREILTAAAYRPTRDEITAELDRIRALTPKGPAIDSTALIREGRDSR